MASAPNLSTNACDETNPRVNVTFNCFGYVSRRSSMAASCARPSLSSSASFMNIGVTR